MVRAVRRLSIMIEKCHPVSHAKVTGSLSIVQARIAMLSILTRKFPIAAHLLLKRFFPCLFKLIKECLSLRVSKKSCKHRK